MIHKSNNTRRGMAVAVMAAIGLSIAAPVKAADWKPTKDVEILVTVGAGSGPDQMARLIQAIWHKYGIVQATTTVANKVGGGGAIGWNYLNGRHAGDGHNIAIGGASMISNNISNPSVTGYEDLTPLVHLVGEYIAIAVHPNSPIKTGQDLIDRLKSDPQSVSLGIATSKGNSNHQAIAIPAKLAGIDIRKLKTVIFQSGNEARTAVMGRHVDVVPASIGSMIKQKEAGQLRFIAVASPERLHGPAVDVPTWREQGYDAVVSNWRGIIGPKGLGAAEVAYWENVFAKTIETDEWKRSMEAAFQETVFMKHDELLKYCDAEKKAVRSVLVDLELAK